MIPIAGTVFWGPMAVTVMGGLFVATLLTLIVLPVFYVAAFRIGPDDPPDAAPDAAASAVSAA
jgi:Cu/Ag efflux pump CusA